MSSIIYAIHQKTKIYKIAYASFCKMIVVINFGAQYAHLIARRVRELGVHSEIVKYDISAKDIKAMNPDGIILSGGPSSVNIKDAPLLEKAIMNLKIPILGICYGHQLLGKYVGGTVSNKGVGEYGKKALKIKGSSMILKGIKKQSTVWMSHFDSVNNLPKTFSVLASTNTCAIASFESHSKKIYGVQFHPEVVHTEAGMQVLKNFVLNICMAKKDWNIWNITKKIISEISDEAKNDSVIMGTSGGVDSTVASVLISRAIGKKLHCVFIDHGLIRKNELEEVKAIYKRLKLNVHYADASRLFLRKLAGVTDPEKKRTIIGHTFIEVFEKEAKRLEQRYKTIKFLGQGTIYPDRIESAEPSKQASKIKSHHNVTLPEKMKLKVIEPLKEFYKDEVRKIGAKLGLPYEILWRHPFPGPGLAIRIVGEITDERLRILKEADYIYIEELKKHNYYNKIWQAFAALLPVKTVGVQGDARTYAYIISLRAVTSKDAMTADWARLPDWLLETISNRIINEVKGVNRVVYDISQKPPATIEYE